jgi:hypothetical protein
MKPKIFLILAFITAYFYSSGQARKADTTFLLKETSNGICHAIFVDENKTSKFYKQISDFTFYNYDKDNFNSSLKYLKEKHISLSRKVITQVPKKWIPLYQYKNKLYLYYPCDFYFHFIYNITDTAFIDYTGEGPVANKIIDFKIINDTTFQFQLTAVTNPTRSLIIHVIDRNRGVAVFEEKTQENGKHFYLMVSADKIKSFPVIVNYCPSQKQDEFQFDKPNYYKLLKAK